MITNLELYGTEDVPLVPAKVANRRINLLKERLKVLCSVHYMEQDNNLINRALEGVTFWTKLRDGDTI